MQISRLFEIIYVLQDGKVVTAGELASRLEVSQRTIYRDIDTLCAAGMPIYTNKGRGGGISLLPNFVLNRTILTETEKQAILASLSGMKALNFTKTDTAFNKLNALFGGSNVNWIEVDFSDWGDSGAQKQLFKELKTAILTKQKVSFAYSNGKGQTWTRTVCPLKLYFKGQAWYLYAYCTTRAGDRFFKLSRIRELSVLAEGFTREAEDIIFTEDNIFKETMVVLKLRLSARMAHRVYDEFQHFEQCEDGSFIAQKDYPLGAWLFGYVASFGADCEVLEPKSVRDDVAGQFKKILQQYL